MSLRNVLGCGAGAVALALGVAGSAQGALVNLQGDLGNQTWPGGSALPLAPGNTIVEPFSVVAGTGTLTGEVHAENIGGVFGLTITNLVYEATADGAAPGAHSIELSVGQEYVAAPGPYNATHEFNGTAELGAGQNAFVSMLTTHNFSDVLPSISDTVSGPGAAVPFGAGPAGVASNAASTVYVIETILILSLDGGFPPTASITLPASAHTTATLVPAPGVLGMALGFGVVGARRRR